MDLMIKSKEQNPKSQIKLKGQNPKIQNKLKEQNPKSQVANPNKKYDLKDRTAKFGEDIIKMAKSLENNLINRSLISQVVRSGTSIGANYMEADGAESKKDFYHKIALCKKESKETVHWLKMILVANPDKQIIFQQLTQEVHELALIFSSILCNKKY